MVDLNIDFMICNNPFLYIYSNENNLTSTIVSRQGCCNFKNILVLISKKKVWT